MEKLLLVCCFILVVSATKYQPTWESIDSRPLPSWYDESKLGIFIHWGVFSVPSFSSEWFWHDWKMTPLPGVVDFMKQNYPPDWTYADFAPQFTTEFYSAAEWASIFKASGAKFVPQCNIYIFSARGREQKYIYIYAYEDVHKYDRLCWIFILAILSKLANFFHKVDGIFEKSSTLKPHTLKKRRQERKEMKSSNLIMFDANKLTADSE